jgi:transposase
MEQPVTIGIDLAKNVFQVHGVGADGQVVLRRKLRRAQMLEVFGRLSPCLIGMEACAGAHHWARELATLGHEVRLMPPSYVKPYVKRGKTDQADAEAICEAVTRPTMRFVPVKSAERQAALVDHKTREFLVRQQTQTVNAIRAHLAEFGIVMPKGIQNVDRLLTATGETPEAARPALDLLAAQLRDTRARIADLTKRIEAAQAEDALARRLATIPGIGALTASALAATTPEVDAFRSARDYAAWLGLTPKPHSTGGKERLGRISKAGNRYLRRLLFLGASCRRHASGVTARISACRGRKPGEDWLSGMLQRKRAKVVAIALANRMARVVWALIRSGESYRANPA